jgi:hypothetical protein
MASAVAHLAELVAAVEDHRKYEPVPSTCFGDRARMCIAAATPPLGAGSAQGGHEHATGRSMRPALARRSNPASSRAAEQQSSSAAGGGLTAGIGQEHAPAVVRADDSFRHSTAVAARLSFGDDPLVRRALLVAGTGALNAPCRTPDLPN